MANFDAVSGSNGAAAGSLTFAHTISGSNPYLLIFTTTRTGVTISSVTYNGIAAAFLGSVNIAVATEDGFLYGLAAPTPGTNNIIVTYSGPTNCYAIGISGFGVDQSASTGPLAVNNGNSAQGSLTVLGAPNDLAVVFAASDTTGNLAATADAPAITRRQDQAQNYSAGGCTDNGAASVAFGWGLAPATNWGLIGVSLRAPASGPLIGSFIPPLVWATRTRS